MASTAARCVFMGSDRNVSLLYEECPMPTICDGEILAKVRLATICGSDIHTIDGKRKESTPSILGHEGVLEVVESKRSDDNIKEGDRITFCITNTCGGECTNCKLDLPQKCKEMSKYGHSPLSSGSGFNGCYASHVVLSSGTMIYPLPRNVSDKMAAPINCALATMVNMVSKIPKDDKFSTAVIQGSGLLGLYGAALLRERGFNKVYVSDIDQDRLLMVPRFGGIPLNTASSSCMEVPDAGTIDVVLEVCGSPSVIKEGLYYLRMGGMYLLAGMVHPDSRLDITGEQIIRKCLTIKGIHNYAPEHLEEAVKFISKTTQKYPYSALLSPSQPLRDMPAAVALAKLHRFHRVAIDPSI